MTKQKYKILTGKKSSDLKIKKIDNTTLRTEQTILIIVGCEVIYRFKLKYNI